MYNILRAAPATTKLSGGDYDRYEDGFQYLGWSVYRRQREEEPYISQRREISLTCPQCGKEHPFIIWNSINTTLNLEMKEAVKDCSAFRFVCPDCGAKTYIDYDLLYHQMEDRIMIHYARLDESAEQIYQMLTKDDPEDMVQDMLRNHYLIRIVRSQNQLR